MLENTKFWESQWGARYDHEALKAASVRSAVEDLNLPAQSVALDLGAGAFPTSLMVPREGNQGYRSVLVDVAARKLMPEYAPDFTYGDLYESCSDSDRAELFVGDVDSMARAKPEGRQQKKALKGVLAEMSRDAEPLVDVTFLSEILNYVHSQKALKLAHTFMRQSGLMVVVNQAHRGHADYFSPNGIQTDEQLFDELEKLNMSIEHTDVGQSTWDMEPDVTIVVARK